MALYCSHGCATFFSWKILNVRAFLGKRQPQLPFGLCFFLAASPQLTNRRKKSTFTLSETLGSTEIFLWTRTLPIWGQKANKKILSRTAGWQVRAWSCTVSFLVVCGRHGRLKRFVYGYIVSPGLVSGSTIEVTLLRRLGLLGKLPTNVRISGQELSGCWAQGCHGGDDTEATVEEQMSNTMAWDYDMAGWNGLFQNNNKNFAVLTHAYGGELTRHRISKSDGKKNAWNPFRTLTGIPTCCTRSQIETSSSTGF